MDIEKGTTLMENADVIELDASTEEPHREKPIGLTRKQKLSIRALKAGELVKSYRTGKVTYMLTSSGKLYKWLTMGEQWDYIKIARVSAKA